MSRPASGRLIGLISGDLPEHRLARGPDGSARFVPDSGVGPVLIVGERVKKRFLGRTEIAQFHTVLDAPGWRPARLRVGVSGRLKRQGVAVEVAEGSEDVVEWAEILVSDPGFSGFASNLDFTRFDIELDGEMCLATVELMGASYVSIALPPIRSYVRLHPDQREALIGCFSALERLAAPG